MGTTKQVTGTGRTILRAESQGRMEASHDGCSHSGCTTAKTTIRPRLEASHSGCSHSGCSSGNASRLE